MVLVFLQLPLPETFLDSGFIFFFVVMYAQLLLDLYFYVAMYALYLCAPRSFPDYGSFSPALQI